MYYIEKDIELTPTIILPIVAKFQTCELPILQRYWDYYQGKQDIMNKFYKDSSKPCNRVVVNYCLSTVQNYQGYLTGKEITYSSNNDISDIQDILNYNDCQQEDAEFLKQALIFGCAYECNWIDQDSKQRFNLLDPRTIIPLYYNTLDKELGGVVRFYKVNDTDYYIDVYTQDKIDHYKSAVGFSSMNFIDSEINYFNQIPITILELQDGKSIFDSIMGLQDAYNKLISAEVDDYEAFVDAYLVLKGMDVDEEQLPEVRKNRVFDVGMDGEVSYLTKEVNDQQIENILNNIEQKIHTISCSPDFTDESFGTSSGIALRHRLLGFENQSASIEKSLIKALQKRIELICSYVTLLEGENVWRDIQITVTHNLPIDYQDIVNIVNGLRGLVSKKTLLAQIPFIADVERELEAVEKETSIYNFENE